MTSSMVAGGCCAVAAAAGRCTCLSFGTGRISAARVGWPAGSTTVSSLWVAASSSVLACLVWSRSPWPLPHHPLECPPCLARRAGRRLQVTSLEACLKTLQPFVGGVVGISAVAALAGCHAADVARCDQRTSWA